MVGTGALHLAAGILGAAPEVAAADHQAHLNTHIQALLDDIAHLADDFKIQAGMLITSQSLAADFQQDSLINRFSHIRSSIWTEFHTDVF